MIGFYDNVHLMMWGYHDISPLLGNVKKIVSQDGSVIGVVGGYEGLKVRDYPNGTSIIGSFAKFLHGGSNIEPLDVHSIKEAMERLSDDFHVDVSQAQVTMLEFGTQFPMSEPVGAYLCRLGYLSKFNRSTLSEGNLESLYYKQSAKTLKFYDKGQEARRKGMKMPNGWFHLLKYEMTLTKRLKRFFGFTPTVIDLYDKDNYRRLAMLWKELYQKIDKQKLLTMTKEYKKLTASNCFKNLSGFAIGNLDKEFIIGYIDELKAMGIERKELYRLKQLIKKASVDAIPDELMTELDDCINNAVAYL